MITTEKNTTLSYNTNKLDAILVGLQTLTNRMESLKNKIHKYEARLRELNIKISTQSKTIKNISLKLVDKASKNDFEDVLDFIIDLKNQAEGAKRDYLSRESYSKHFNLLIHGLDESKVSPSEPKAETQLIFDEFLTQGLHLDPIEIPLVDIHKLPQRPIGKSLQSIKKRKKTNESVIESLNWNEITTANLHVIAHYLIVLVDKDMGFFAVDLSSGKLCISWKKHCMKVLSLCNTIMQIYHQVFLQKKSSLQSKVHQALL